MDRSGAYAARYLARNLLDILKLDECKVKLAYSIGVAKPVMVSINGRPIDISELPGGGVDLTPKGIKELLKLDTQKYYPTAKW